MVMTGYGMTGALNEYNSHVLVGNWCEDRRGVELAVKLKPAECTNWASTTQDFFSASNSSPELQKQLIGAATTRTQIKERMRGVPSKLLFAHVVSPGHGDKLNQDRFKTTNNTSYTATNFEGPDARQLAWQHDARVARERRAAEEYATTTSLMARRK